MATAIDLSHTNENLLVHNCEPIAVQAIESHKGEDDGDLTFSKGDILTLFKRDGCGYAKGALPTGVSGWFPIDKVEELHDQPIADIGTVTGQNALDMFVREIEDHPSNRLISPRNRMLAPIKLQDERRSSMDEFLSQHPVTEKDLPSDSKTLEHVEEAQKRLLHLQKKQKTEIKERIIVHLRKGIAPSNPFDLAENEIDQLVVEVLCNIPLGKHKYLFSHYENVFTGSELIKSLRIHAHKVINHFHSGISEDEAQTLAQNLLERNIITNVIKPSKTKFKSKHLFEITAMQTMYTVLNLDKIISGKPINPYKASIDIVRSIANVLKSNLPNVDKIRHSKELVHISMKLASIQNSTFNDLNPLEKAIFFINMHNALVMFTHMKFQPPSNSQDRTMLYEYCSIFTNNRKYSIQELYDNAVSAVDDPLIYCCLSECVEQSPGVFVYSVEDYEQTKACSMRHFLHRCLVVDSTNYEIKLPRTFYHMQKELELNDKKLIELITPFASKDRRDMIQELQSVGFEIQFEPSSFNPHYLLESDM